MNTNDTFLAIFLANKTSPRMTAWNALSEEARHSQVQEGIAAWKAWVEKHQAAIVGMGGPLGKTKKVSEHGIEDISNLMSAYTVVRAEFRRGHAGSADTRRLAGWLNVCFWHKADIPRLSSDVRFRG